MKPRLHIARLPMAVPSTCSICATSGELQHLDSDLRQLSGCLGFLCPECKDRLIQVENLLLSLGLAQPTIDTPCR